MEHYLSERVKNLATSQTLAMAAKARELRGQGKDVIGLSLGEPDFNIPDFIKEAAKKAIDENYNSYTPVDGYLDLKKAIIKKFERDNGLIYSPSQIVVSTGAKQALYNIASVLINPGDEVILPCPYWVSYADIVKLKGGIPVEVNDAAIFPAIFPLLPIPEIITLPFCSEINFTALTKSLSKLFDSLDKATDSNFITF